MKTLTLKINESLDNWLATEAERLGRTKSEIAREALERRRAGEGTGSLYDLARDLCGVIKGGPRDVSTNKKYLKGMGRGGRTR